jgi:hypothetical protein
MNQFIFISRSGNQDLGRGPSGSKKDNTLRTKTPSKPRSEPAQGNKMIKDCGKVQLNTCTISMHNFGGKATVHKPGDYPCLLCQNLKVRKRTLKSAKCVVSYFLWMKWFFIKICTLE